NVNATNVFIPPCCAPPPPVTTADLVAPATVTILNDDVGLVPANQNVAKGHDATILLLLGAGSSAPETIGLASSGSNVAKVPSVLYLAAGQRSVSLTVTTGNPGTARISFTLPAALGAATLTSQIGVFEPANLVLSPAPAIVPLGGTVNVSVSVVPPLTTPLTLPWTVVDATKVSAPPSIVINPGQSGSLLLKGIKLGSTIMSTNVGPDHGSVAYYLPVDVVEAPPPLALTGINPPIGPIAGGTLVTISGANIRNDCTV